MIPVRTAPLPAVKPVQHAPPPPPRPVPPPPVPPRSDCPASCRLTNAATPTREATSGEGEVAKTQEEANLDL